MRIEQIASLEAALKGFVSPFEVGFARRATFEHCKRYVKGLLAEGERRKSCESIALDAGVPVRTMQEFLSLHRWDHERVNAELQRRIADRGHELRSLLVFVPDQIAGAIAPDPPL